MLQVSKAVTPTMTLTPTNLVASKIQIPTTSTLSPLPITLSKSPVSADLVSRVAPSTFTATPVAVDGGSGVGLKVGIGVAIAALLIGGVYMATRPGGFSANAKRYKTSSRKREYMKGYRAGRKFCG